MTIRGGQPLNRVSLVAPFCERLEAAGADLDAVLAQVGLSREIVSAPDVFVPAAKIYEFCEAAASAVDDPLLGVKIGLSLTSETWRPDREASTNAHTLVEYLTQFVILVGNHAGATRYQLEVAAPNTRLSYHRAFKLEKEPVQVNAMGIGRIVAILQRSLGDEFDPQRLTVRTPAPEAAIAAELAGVHFARAAGETIYSFPLEWLMAHLAGGAAPVNAAVSRPPGDIVDAVRKLVGQHFVDGEISLKRVARMLRRSRRGACNFAKSSTPHVGTLRSRRSGPEPALRPWPWNSATGIRETSAVLSRGGPGRVRVLIKWTRLQNDPRSSSKEGQDHRARSGPVAGHSLRPYRRLGETQ